MEDIVPITGTENNSSSGASSNFLTSSSSGVPSGVSDTECRSGHISQNASQEAGGAGEKAALMVYQDVAVTVEETGGRHGIVKEGQSPPENPLHRLLLVSSKIRNSSVMKNALLPNVIFVHYKYDSSTLESILG